MAQYCPLWMTGLDITPPTHVNLAVNESLFASVAPKRRGRLPRAAAVLVRAPSGPPTLPSTSAGLTHGCEVQMGCG